MSDRIDTNMFRTLLIERRDSVLEVSREAREAARTVELDQTRTGRLSRMDALQGQAMARATGERRRMELLRIQAALTRLDDGEYGECLACGKAISTGRLETDPTATLCIACAEQAEETAVKR